MKSSKPCAVLLVVALSLGLLPASHSDPTPVRGETPSRPSPWMVDTARAQAGAAKAGWLVMYYFHRANSDACEKFEKNVLLGRLLPFLESSAVMVKVDTVSQKRFAQSFGVTQTPALVFVSSKGEELARTTGFVTAREVYAALSAAAWKQGPPTAAGKLEEASGAMRRGQFSAAARLASEAAEAARSLVLKRHAIALEEAVARTGKSLVDLAGQFESNEQWYEAAEVYDDVVEAFDDLPAGNEAQKALARLQADPGISAEIRNRSALESKARDLYQKGAIALDDGDTANARKLLEEVKKRFPGTTYALAAQNKLEQIESGEPRQNDAGQDR